MVFSGKDILISVSNSLLPVIGVQKKDGFTDATSMMVFELLAATAHGRSGERRGDLAVKPNVLI
ncbi:hypothetical protein KHS38_00245 [Mucilaginibacter sp. Bleaf8]|uniref:hypothetical protein n=1 Tax=Mucilaginibacter sp. Bleaf8 TaxID=2834430 RepID=UPI001BCD8858|nr:hypothetical protein [Mucilaginibacter sp. Bleaf8]MBS7562819.1 hypothetical protein [Mucilaginibacter sp. Bleaf8]